MVSPSNAARSQLYLEVASASPSEARIHSDIRVIYDASVKFSADLEKLAKQSSGIKKTHVEAARGILGREIADLHTAITSNNNYDWTTAMEAWVNDRRSDGVAFNLVRSDLGLPPAVFALS
jgi:hypothetical protein